MNGTTAGALFGNATNPAAEIAGSVNLAGGGQSAAIAFGGGKR
jgi:hypothetical protein